MILFYHCRHCYCCVWVCVLVSLPVLSLSLPFLALFLKLFCFTLLWVFCFTSQYVWTLFSEEGNWTVDIYCSTSSVFWTSFFCFECFLICLFSIFPLMFQVLLVYFYPLIMIEKASILLSILQVIILKYREHCSVIFSLVRSRISAFYERYRFLFNKSYRDSF